MKGGRIVVMLLAATAAGGPLGAAERSDANTSIEISVRDAKISAAGGQPSVWASSNAFTLRGDERVGLLLKDPNPLLFSFSTTTVTAETSEGKAAGEFAKAVAAVLGAFKGKGGGGGTPCVIEGVDVADLIRTLTDLESYTAPKNVTALLAMSMDGAMTATLKQTVDGYDVDGLSRRVSDSYSRLPALGAKCLNGTELAVGEKKVACGAPLFGTGPTVSACVDKNPGSQTVREFVMMTLALQTHTEAALAFLREFSGDVAAVDVPVVLDTKPYSLQKQTVTVSVKPVTRYEKFFNESIRQFQKKRVGDHDVVLNAYRPVRVKLAPAFIVGFITNPTFATARKGSEFVITRTDSSSTSYDVAAMLQIIPAKWSEPTFGGHFQLGVSPNKGEIGFYAGAGVDIERVVGFGAGFMWRQVNRLGQGLSEGQSLAGPELLKTETQFRPGWYVHLTVQLP
jgi:hypothetical protein